MATISEALAAAMRHHQGGNFTAAEQLYRQILSVDPHQPDALHLLGLLAHQAGHHAAAAEWIERAIAINPQAAHYRSNLGEVYRHLGRTAEAIACYERALAINPQWTDALHNLALVRRNQQQFDEAAACYRRILNLAPHDVATHNALGTVLQDQDKLEEAETCFRRAIELQPEFAAAHNSLGGLWWRRRDFDRAVACYLRAIELDPRSAEARINLGIALRDRDELDEAVACFQELLAFDPQNADAYNNLGIIAWMRKELDEAERYYRRALELQPGLANALQNLGALARERGQLAEAARLFQQAIQTQPNPLGAYLNLATIFKEQGRFYEEAACYEQALKLQPNASETHNNLGVALACQGNLPGAEASYRRALEIDPDYANALYNLGATLAERRELPESLDCFRRAWQANPASAAAICALVHTQQHLGSWDDLQALSEQIAANVAARTDADDSFPTSPFYFTSLPTNTTAAQQLRCAEQWANYQLRTDAHTTLRRPPAIPRTTEKPLTIGYLSPDFRAHPVAALIVEVFERHDRRRVRTIGYSYGRDDGSPLRKRIASAVDLFVDVRRESFVETAERIAADRVDILVDLAGYTNNARTPILALRPAPLAVNYLGYPGTLGTSCVDYILVDPFIAPADQQPYYTEQLVQLPHCYQPNDSQREIDPRTPTRAECGLPETGFVFCSFNNSYKTTPELFAVWMELLAAVPGSVLWLLEGNPFMPDNLRREAMKRGIAPERLIFAPLVAMPQHLARQRLADLFLDTFPYNAHTTASDALWAGLPLVTLAGETFCSRVAGSLLRTVGLPELVTTSLANYQALALKLASDPTLLAGYRAHLAANRATSPLFDGALFARHLEQAYEHMWARHIAGEAPRGFAVDA